MPRNVINGGIRLGLVGASGYSGQVLHALAMQHPCISEVVIPERGSDDKPSDHALETLCACDVVVLALPHVASKMWVERLLNAGCSKIIDLSDAYRCDDRAHYGLPELFGAPATDCKIIANPGCYPTAAILALRPLIDRALIDTTHIAINGVSGATGAGKKLSEELHFCHLSENTFPYQVGDHRHIPEIETHLGRDIQIALVTQILAIQRGMLVTAFVRPRVTASEIHQALYEHYSSHPYVSVLPKADRSLGLRNVVGSHQALLATGPVVRSNIVPVFASIDNLMRGAASQAMHNLNLWMAWPEHFGLPAPQRASMGVPPCWASQLSTLSGSSR